MAERVPAAIDEPEIARTYDDISPDIIEWLVSDDRVVAKWKSLAACLGLESYVPAIDVDYPLRKPKLERQKLSDLLQVWKKVSPASFTRHKLMDALGREGLCDMLMWLELMATDHESGKTHMADRPNGSGILKQRNNSRESAKKTLRFADEFFMQNNRKGADLGVEKYFDNLIAMIKKSAEGL